MIPRRTIEQILDAAKIEEVVGDFVTLKRRGADYVACCPFHNEKTPSFHVSPSKGIFKCFGCGKSGTAPKFIMEHENLTWPEALKYLAKKYHIEVVEKEETAEDIAARQKSESLMIVSEFAGKFFVDQLKTPEGRVGYAYFKSRGLEDGTMAEFGLGWAPNSRNALQTAARQAGFKEEYLIDSGLCFRTEDGKVLDRFYERAVFPIHNVNGRIVAFGCRTLKNDKSVAKYVNSPETEIYLKRNTLYGMYQAKSEIHRQDKFILVEGYLDVITMHQLGITNVAASSGTSLTVEQVKLIKRFTENVTIIYDGDAAGIHAALRGIGLVLEGGLNVKVVLLPDGDDPDSFGRKHTKDEVLDFIRKNEQDFIGFKTRFLLDDAGRDPIRRAALINDIADTIALIPDPVKRNVYVPYAAGELGVDEQLMFDRIKRTRTRMLEEKRRAQERKENDMLPVQHEPPLQEEPQRDAYQGVPLVTDPLVNDRELVACERELLGFVLRNGQDTLEFSEDSPYWTKEAVTVSSFIDSVLYDDGAEFSNEAYRRVYEKYFELAEQNLDNGQISVRLLSDPDSVIRQLTADIVEDKHPLTVQKFEASLTNDGTVLTRFVPRALLAYGKARVEKKLKQLSAQLKMSERTARDSGESSSADMEEILKEIIELNKLKTTLTVKLGRV